MFGKDPISIEGPMGQTFHFTRHYRHNDPFNSEPIAFPHERVFAKEALTRLAEHSRLDPFNYQLYEVWQMVFQKPWTQPRSLHLLIADLADRVQRGELYVYRSNRPISKDITHGVPSTEEDWWDTTVGAVKGFANDLIRLNAGMNREWMAEKGIIEYRERSTGRELTPEEVGQRYEEEGKDYFELENPAEEAGAEMAENSTGALLAAEAVMLVGSRGRNVVRDPQQFAHDLRAALTNVRSETEALGKAGLEQAKRRLGHTTDDRYVDRYHGPDDMTSKDGKLTEWEAKGNNRDTTAVATDSRFNLQGSRGKNQRRAATMVRNKAPKVGQESGRQGGAYQEGEIDLWGEVLEAGGKKQHISVHTNTGTGRVRVFERDHDGQIERQLDDFTMDNFDEMESAIKQEFAK